ncbi:MAG TPA: NTP transferase domain-containing protein [Propionibacteriaceae bacterium]
MPLRYLLPDPQSDQTRRLDVMRDGGAPGGLLLAAGAGRRMGTPKALVDDWLIRGVDVIAAAGCSPVVVVLGAALQQAQALLQGLPVIVSATADWRNGLGASLRSGILALPAETPAAVVMLVDLPDVGEKVIRRVLEAGSGPGTLTRASYHGRPGHPVVLGRAHWPGILATANGDVGARAYLDRHAPALVECADLASGRDIDSSDEAITSGGMACAR